MLKSSRSVCLVLLRDPVLVIADEKYPRQKRRLNRARAGVSQMKYISRPTVYYILRWDIILRSNKKLGALPEAQAFLRNAAILKPL